MSKFADLIRDGRPHVFDGAMGTMLYAKGVFINRCFDELTLADPELVKDIHRAYVAAGAELLETNSYGANRAKLSQYGLEGKVREVNLHAARLAKAAAASAAGGGVLVGGSMGPLGIRIEPYGPTSLDEARDIFHEQAASLAEGGVDFFVLETFSDLEEIAQAMRAVREAAPDLPVVAQMTIQQDGATTFGTDPEHIAARLEELGADVIGLNCSLGPHGILSAIERMARVTSKPLSAQPNAGLPRDVQGRQLYMASPEYMAKYAQRLIRAGAHFVGGCCGTTPAHIASIVGSVRALSPGHARVHVDVPEDDVPESPTVQLAERSAWGRKLAEGRTVTSVEIVPPRGIEPATMLAGVRLLRDAGVDGVNVPDGPRAQMRMGVIATSVLIEQVAGIEAVVHYTCRDRNLLGMLSDLLGAHALGLRNLLLITGDPPKMGPYPEATAVFDIDAIGLTHLVSRLNRGLDPGSNPIGRPTAFTIGVGANPGATDLDTELKRFYWKVEAGAEYAITQPVFVPEQLVAFIDELRKRDIWVPVVPGIWPLVSARNAEFLANEVPGIVLPDEIIQRMRRASEKGKEHGVREGIAIAREMFEQVAGEVQGVQVSAPFGRIPLALEVLDGVDGVRSELAGVTPVADHRDELGFAPPRRREPETEAATPLG